MLYIVFSKEKYVSVRSLWVNISNYKYTIFDYNKAQLYFAPFNFFLLNAIVQKNW